MSDISPLKKTTDAKPANSTEDVQFAQYLMKDLQDLLCVDTSRIYAAGMGTGGGMMHMMACNKMLSSQIAAFAAVSGAFGAGKKGSRPWGSCRNNRTVPLIEIHGLDNGIYGYYLNEGENGKMRKIPGHWVEEWADRNKCGDAVGETEQSTKDEATFVTRLENGIMTETIDHRGSAIRKAWKCFDGATTPAEKAWVHDGPLNGGNVTILHYQVKGYGHGWPRLLLRKERDVVFKDTRVKLRGGSYFDTTDIILDFFKSHPLPAEFDQQEPLEINIPPQEDIQKQQDELDKQPQNTKEELKERIKQLAEAHEKMKKINQKQAPESPNILKDEL
jgi:poly(3-hydroxybutyrate) depolymerase